LVGSIRPYEAPLTGQDACKLSFEGIVSKRLGSPCRSDRSQEWIKAKHPAAPAVKLEAEEDWGGSNAR
jgi:ATP-dependent DNA ligase